MSKFDTNGGYFAPKDYLRVNEGGSHEENPNGGVQIGVDPEGNPNLLEEGEPVYKDYVYSDNITAEKEFLEQNNLPGKYEGKLYSKIADDFVTEAEERPLDPISRNGLEAMLSRLADAQEGQKQRDQQNELEDELANLSPEELDQLEAMLAQSEQAEPMVAPEQETTVPAEMPMMGFGGTLLHKFGPGGSLDDELSKAMQERLAARKNEEDYKNSLRDYRLSGIKGLLYGLEAKNAHKRAVKELGALEAMKEAYISGQHINGGIGEEDAIIRQQKRADRARQREQKIQGKTMDAVSSMNEANKQMNYLRFPFVQSFVPVDEEVEEVESTVAPLLAAPSDTIATPDAASSPAPVVLPEDDWDATDVNISDPFLKYGGNINRYDDGGWGKFMDALRGYRRSTRQGGITGTYAIDRSFPLGTKFKTIEDLENSDAYRAFTEYVVKNYQDPNVQAYLRLLDDQTHRGVTKLFNGDTLRDDWETLYRDRRNDHLGGIYHFSHNVNNLQPPVAETVAPAQNPQNISAGSPYTPFSGLNLQSGPMYDWMKDNPTGLAYRPKQQEEPTLFPGVDLTWNGMQPKQSPVTANTEPEPARADSYNYSALPTWPRYAGAIGSGLLGLYNVFQQPDKYTATRINPYTPEGRIHLQNQVYNPIDQNMVANAQIAQGNATRRALQNSGMGPSTGAAILAADNNLTGNLGTGFIQSWDANNQRRNAVIAANNQAEAQRAQFDANIDYYRKDAMNKAAMYNAQNDLMIQRLNNAAEGEKYAAISNQIANGLQALSGIGQENFAMNQVNSNPAYLGYRVGPNGMMFYNPNTGEWETVNSKKS